MKTTVRADFTMRKTAKCDFCKDVVPSGLVKFSSTEKPATHYYCASCLAQIAYIAMEGMHTYAGYIPNIGREF